MNHNRRLNPTKSNGSQDKKLNLTEQNELYDKINPK